MTERKGNAGLSAYGSEFNQLDFLIRSIVKGMVSTAIPVRVDSVERAGDGSGALYVSATPLVCPVDADGNALEQVTIPRLPYFRLQHGTAAVVVDPKVGDLGLAVFAQLDTSRLTGQSTPEAPATFRCFDMSDGFYLGGFWGKPPETFVRLEDSGDITITGPKTVTINAEVATVNASDHVLVDSPQVTMTGRLSVVGHITGTGGVTVSNGDVTADGISLKSHVHGGVQSGSATTSQAK